MILVKSLSAVLQGLRLCFLNPEIRKLAIRPWLVSAVCYLAVGTGALLSHGPLLEMLVPNPEGFWMQALYWLTWAGLYLFLLIATLSISLILALVLSGVFQDSIARKTLAEFGAPVPEEDENVGVVVKDIGRSVATEATKLFWIIPLLVCLFIMGFIPFLSPIVFILAAWFLAYESFDVVYEIHKLSTKERLKKGMSNWPSLIAFGLGLTFFGLIPLAGILLPPVAVSAAAWLWSERSHLDE